MRTSASRRLQKAATLFSQQAAEQLQKIQEREAAERRRREEIQRAAAAREAAEAAAQKAAIAKRLPLARKGLARLIALASSVDIQKLIAAVADGPGNPYLSFYSVARVTGFYWDASKEQVAKMNEDGGVVVNEYDSDSNSTFSTRRSPYDEEHLEVTMDENSLGFTSGLMSHAAGFAYYIFYREVRPTDGPPYRVLVQANERLGLRGGETRRLSLEEFFNRIARPNSVNMAAIAQERQRLYAWEPEEVFFQLLVSCGKKSVLDRYLQKCLAALEAQQQEKHARRY